MARTKKELEQLRILGKMLFIHESLTQKEISGRIGVSQVTISKWSTEDNWDNYKVSITITKEEQLKSMYRQLANMNEVIAGREQKYPTPPEADAISKLANAIEKMEADIGVSDIISVGKKFIDWVRKFDLKRAQEFTPLFDAFIKDNLR